MLFGNNDIEVDESEALLTYHYISIGYITLMREVKGIHYYITSDKIQNCHTLSGLSYYNYKRWYNV